jgi:hypothetical protein
MNRLFFLGLLLTQLTGWAQHPALLPLPRELTWTKSAFVLTGYVQIKTNQTGIRPAADSIARFVREVGHIAVNDFVAPDHGGKLIELLLEPDGTFSQRPEGYALTITSQSVQLRAATVQGLYWGYQTIRQLYTRKPRPSLAGCTITDYPAFPIRGFMHDVGRSFIPLERLKQHISVLARYKINTFHWHLTEDLAWRLASDSLPQLTDSSITARFPGQFYTKQQARELADFCRAHNVLLIPELDMPGHSGAFRRATGYDMQSERGKALIAKLLREVCALFDVPYIHIGTDEVAVKDASFVPEMAAVVRAFGKEVIGWYPGAALDGNAIRQLWIRNDRPLPPMRFIESRNLYFNHFATQADLISLFQRNLCDVPAGTPDRLGAIGCVWNDRKVADVDQIERLNGFYPLMLTLAERAWRGGGQPETEAGTVLRSTATFAEFETRLLAHKTAHFGKLSFPYVRQSGMRWRLSVPYPNGGDLSAQFPPETDATDFPGGDATGATIYLRHTWGPGVVRAYVSDPKPNHTAYAYTYVFSPRRQWVGAWIDFHNYGRSEKDASPPRGAWDYKGSRIWLNGKLLEPPGWLQPGMHPATLETIYTNEPYENRPPMLVQLQKGWNKLLLKLPVGAFQTSDYRLVKWMFTCVFVRSDGMNVTEASDLILSPDRRKK